MHQKSPHLLPLRVSAFAEHRLPGSTPGGVLWRNSAAFLATNADRTCPVEGGEIPDAGAIIGALEGCSNRQVELVVGKPSPLIMEMALGRLGLPADACLPVPQ